MFKRILACLMVLLTLVSYLPPMASAEETQPQEETTEVSTTQPSEPETVPTEPTAAAEETTAPTEETSPDEMSSDETLPEEALVDTYALPGDDGAVASGECGDNLTWSIDDENVLTISGTGAMWDYEEVVDAQGGRTSAPWYAYSPEKLVLEEGVTYIGEFAFHGCGFTGSLTLPESLTSIGTYAFSQCYGFTGSLVLPENLTSIGGAAFIFCRGFTGSLTLPKNLTSIEWDAFLGCSGLTSVTIPESVKEIGGGAFSNCSNLSSIIVDGNTDYDSVDNVLFNKDHTTLLSYPAGKKDTSYVVPESVKSIGACAFMGADLSSLTLPQNLTSIGWSAFETCRNLTSMTIPDSVTSIGFAAFRFCSSLTSVTIPWQVTKIEEQAFRDCANLMDVYYMGGQARWNRIEILDGNEPLNIATIHFESTATVRSGDCGDSLTWSVDTDGTLTISGTGAMWDYSEIFVGDGDSHTTAPWYTYSPTKLVLERGITYIGEYAFSGCGIAGDLTLPDGVTEIGENAFAYCSGLTSVVLSQSVAWLDNLAFLNCSGISSLTMPKGVTGIGYAAFRGCGSLTSVTIPASVIDIRSAAFSDCSSLENIAVDGKNIYYISVDGVLFNKNRTTLVTYPSGKKGTAYTIPKGVTSIGANAFSYCRNLIDVTIPETVTSIGGDVFNGCSNLVSVTIPKSVTSIGSSAFENCSSLTNVTIPENVTSIEWGTFYGCKSLTGVTIPENVTVIGGNAFDGCSSLISVKIPKSVVSIGEFAFGYCGSLTDVVIPENVPSIAKVTFVGCKSLTSVTIPKSVTAIGVSAFNGCDSMKDVYYTGNQSQWDKIKIYDCNESLLGATLHLNSVAPAASGKCGDDLVWALTDDGVLTISGTGEMADYPNFPDVPWYDDREKIMTAVIEPGVTNICSFAFFGCKNLTNVTIPEGVTSIGSYAFNACNLTSMEIPASVTAIGTLDDSALGGAGRNLTAYFVDEQNTAYTSVDGILFSKDGTVLVAYPQGKKDPSYSIPESVTCIASDAFGGSRLTSVTIPESVTSIRLGAFFGCNSLTSITIPKSVVSIGDLALADCANLSNIYADEENTVYTSVDGILFNKEKTTLAIYPSGRKNTSYRIPGGVTSIGDYAFDGCGLTSVTIPGSVTSIGSSAFSGCPSLKDVYYAGTQTQWDAVQIGDYNGYLFRATLHFKFANSVAFGSCGDNLTWDIDADRTLTISGIGAMLDYEYTTDDNGDRHTAAPWYAYSPTKLVIEDGVTYIGHYAFLGCGLTGSVTIPATVTGLGWESFGLCSGLTDVTIPASLTKIRYGTFNGCTGLTIVVIPEGVPMIDGIAFAGCTGLTSIVIPESVTKIEWGAFKECGSLEDVYYAGNKTQWDEIEIAEYNEPLLNAAIHFNSVGPCPELTLDREYITLSVGAEPVQLQSFPEYARKAVVWSVENPDGVNVIEVSGDGCVTPLNAGTAYVVASLNTGDGTLTARCRVDVTGTAGSGDVLGVDLGTKKVTTELYSTDYAKIDILLLLEQNEVALFAMPADNGSAITGAYLEDETARQFFDLRVKDDRQLLLVPTQEALDNAKGVKSSYSSKIVVLVNGVEYHTDDAVTISVKKTMPKLKAANLTFNPFYTEQSQALTITGGTVTKVEGTMPDWLTMDGTKLTLSNAPKSGSASLNLLAYTTEWAIPVNVKASVKLSYKAPGLKLSASSVTLSETDSLGVILKLTAGKQSLEELNVKSVTLPAGFEDTELNLYTGEIALVPIGEIPTGKQAVRVSFYGTDSVLDLPLRVNKRTPTLRLSKTSVSLNAELGDSMTLKVTATPADLDLAKVTVTNPSEALEVSPVNENGEFTVTVKQGTATRASYALTVQAPTGRAVKLTVRTLAAGQKVTMSLKAAGSIDLTFPEKGVALQPKYRNYAGELENVVYTLALKQGKVTLDAAFEDYLTVGEDGLIRWNGTGSLESGNVCLITMTGELPNGTMLFATAQVKVTQTPVILRLSKASLSLNKRLEEKTQVTVTTSTRGYTLGDVELLVTDNKNVPSDGLTAAYENGLLTLSVNEKTVYGGSYKVQLWVTPKRVTTLMVRIPAEKKSTVTMTARARGGIDVIRDASEVIVTPAYRNCLDGASLKKQVKVTWAQDGRNYSQDVTEDFILTWAQDGTLHVSKVPGKRLALTGKYRLEILCEGMEKEAYTALSVKCGTARFTVTSVSLYAKDANDMARLTITTTDKTVNTLERVELKDARLKGTYEVLDLGGGQFALCLIPGAKAKTGTVTLNLFCEGNTTAKPSGTVSVKVEIR